MTLDELAMAAYTAYGDYVDWHTMRGDRMPGWHALEPHLQGAWKAAVSRLAEQVSRGEESC